MTKLTPCPFCGAAPAPIDETNFPGDFEHPWEHKGCWLDGVPIRNTTAWNRREQLGQQAAAPGVGQMREALQEIMLKDRTWNQGLGIFEPGAFGILARDALALSPPPVISGGEK